MGMLKATQDLPAVKKMLATAEEILGYDLLKARKRPRSCCATLRLSICTSRFCCEESLESSVKRRSEDSRWLWGQSATD